MTPRFAIVPIEVFERLYPQTGTASVTIGDGGAFRYTCDLRQRPTGRLGAEALERAAMARFRSMIKRVALGHEGVITWKTIDAEERARHIADQRAAFEAAGIGVEGGAE